MDGGEKRSMISLLSVESGVPSERALNKKWIFSKINQEGIRGPLTGALDLVQRCASESKHSGAAQMQGMTSYFIGQEQGADAVDKP